MKLRSLKPTLRRLEPATRTLAAPSSDWHALYSHRAWRRRSAQQLADEPLCRACWHMDGRYVQAEVADHVTPHRGDRDKFFTGELQSLCKHHHDQWKKLQENSGTGDLLPPVFQTARRPLIV